MLPAFDPRCSRLDPGRALAVLAHRPAGVDKAVMWAEWKQVISRFARATADRLDITRTAAGKPHLASGERLWFNASYARHWSLLALSRTGDLGCDVEDRLVEGDRVRLAPLVLHAAESNHLARLAPQEREGFFARCWVRKEAILKAEGTGLSRDPRTVDALPAQPGAGLVIREWHVAEPGDGSASFFAAVASRDPACEWVALQESS